MGDVSLRYNARDNTGRASRSARRNVAGIGTAAGKATTHLKGMAASFVGIGTAAVALRKVTQFMVEGIQAAQHQEVVTKKVEVALRRLGEATEANLQSTINQASAFQDLTGRSNESVQEVQALLLTMGGISQEQLPGATAATLDWAAALGKDLNSAALDVAKALSGNVMMLQRYGVQIDKAAVEAEGAEVVIRKLNEQFGGEAQSRMEITAGKLDLLRENFADLQKVIGQSTAEGGLFHDWVTQASAGIKQLTVDIENFGGVWKGLLRADDFGDVFMGGGLLGAQMRRGQEAALREMVREGRMNLERAQRENVRRQARLQSNIGSPLDPDFGTGAMLMPASPKDAGQSGVDAARQQRTQAAKQAAQERLQLQAEMNAAVDKAITQQRQMIDLENQRALIGLEGSARITQAKQNELRALEFAHEQGLVSQEEFELRRQIIAEEASQKIQDLADRETQSLKAGWKDALESIRHEVDLSDTVTDSSKERFASTMESLGIQAGARLAHGIAAGLRNEEDAFAQTAKGLLPVLGAIAGSVIPGLGTAAGGAIGGAIAGLFHDGGIIRAHRGLVVRGGMQRDEVPIIAQSGEAVLNRDVVRNAGESAINEANRTGKLPGGPVFNVSINAMDARTLQESARHGDLQRVLTEAFQRGDIEVPVRRS